MAFPTGWNRKCLVTIQSSQVSGSATTHSDFPVLLTVDNLPSEMFDKDGTYPAQMGGGDIRFTSDSAGTTPLPCHVVKFITNDTPANGEAIIYVGVDVASDSDTTIYVWYNTSDTKRQPKYNANTDADGFQGSDYVWANYVAMYQLGDFGGLRNLKQANASKNLGRFSNIDSKLYTVSEGGTSDYRSATSMVRIGERLYCAYRQATTHDVTVSGDIEVYVSDDMGQTWSQDTNLSATDASWDLRDPQLMLDDDDVLWLFYSKVDSGDTSRAIHFRKASSPYTSFGSESSAISSGTKMNGGSRPIQLANGTYAGRILVPAYDIDGSGNTFPLVIWTDDDGTSWTEDFLTSTGAAGTYAYDNEFSIAEHPTTAGTIVAIIRRNTSGYLWRTTSTNYGATWGSTYTSVIALAGTAPDMPCIAYAADGDLVCSFAYDRANGKGRFVKSTDDGATWSSTYGIIRGGNEPTGHTGAGFYSSFVEYEPGFFVTSFYYDNGSTDSSIFCTHVTKVEDGDFCSWTDTNQSVSGAIGDGYGSDTTLDSIGSSSLDFFNAVHNASAFTISGWAKIDSTSNVAHCFVGSSVGSADRGFFFAYDSRTTYTGTDCLRLFSASGTAPTSVDNNSGSISATSASAMRLGVFNDANGTPTFIKNASTYSGSNSLTTYSGNAELGTRLAGASYSGADLSAFRLDGWIEMWGFSTVNLGADYEKTRYAAENAPGTFAVEGTPVPAAGGGAVYDETFSASSASALALSDSWALNYAEAFGASATSGAEFTDSYQTPSANYDETFAASAASGAELTDAWSLDYSETFAATAASGATLTDAWLLNYAETFAAVSAAAFTLTDAWALDYAETFAASAASGCDLTHSYAVGNNYAETFAASSVSVATLTHAYSVQYAETFAAQALADCTLVAAWALDYAETFAASSATDCVLTDAYGTPAPGAFDETFAAAAVSACDLTHAFSTPAAIGRVINPTLAASGVPARTLKGLKLIN